MAYIFSSFSNFCLFFFLWLLSFLLFLAFVFSSFSGFYPFCFLSNLVGKQLFFFMLFYLLLLRLPFISILLPFCFSIFHSSLCSTYIFFLPLISFHVPLTSNYQESCHTYLSSLLGPSMDLGLSTSLYISILRISATCCVSWTNRLFGKASPMNGFDVFTSYLLSWTRFIIYAQ